MKRNIVLLFAGALLSAPLYAQEPLIPVYVVQPEAQFEDQALKDRRDSTADLIKALPIAKKVLTIVEDRSSAVVVLEVLGRGIDVKDDSTYVQRDGLGGLKTEKDKDKVLRVKLSVGEYSTVIEGRSKSFNGNDAFTTWRAASQKAASEVGEWVKANRTKLTPQTPQ